MKTPIYVILLLAFVFFSCSKEELDDDTLTIDQNFRVLENDSLSNAIESRSVQNYCFKAPLLTYEGNRVGWIYFNVLDEEIEITYNSSTEYKIIKTNISFIDCKNEDSDIKTGETNVYITSSHGGVNEATVMVNKTDISAVSCYAGFAVVQGANGRTQEVWADSWETYVLADFTDCGWPEDTDEEYEYCNDKKTKVSICHNGNTICVSVNAIQDHLDHGDELGQCD